MNKALSELSRILEIADLSERRAKYTLWRQDYIYHIHKSQLIMNTGQLSLDEHDFICEYLMRTCIDDLIENHCISYEIDSNSYSLDMYTLKQKKSK